MINSATHNECMARLHQVAAAQQYEMMVDALWMAETFPEDGVEFVTGWLAHAVRCQRNAASNAEMARRYLGM